MALLKDITDENGVTASYWRIARITGEYPAITIEVYGYVSKNYRETGTAIKSLSFSVGPDLTRHEMYAFLESTEIFSGAQGV